MNKFHCALFQTCLSAVTATYDRELLFQANEKFIVMIQSRVRGYLARKQYNERVNFMQTQLPAIVRLQVCDKKLGLVTTDISDKRS